MSELDKDVVSCDKIQERWSCFTPVSMACRAWACAFTWVDMFVSFNSEALAEKHIIYRQLDNKKTLIISL